ncbi:MAG TPA: penicillin-binding transpeptidase domain-containing protein, partial [Coleofasciculaceae cyanobacterium]
MAPSSSSNSPNSPKLDQQPERTIGRRYQPLGCLAVAIVLLGGIGGRLAYLQLVDGQRYRQLVAANRIRLMPTLPTRAVLLDRSGRVLVDNRPSLSVMVWPVAQSPQQWQALLPKLAEVLGRPEAELRARMEQAGWRSPVLVRLARGLSPLQMTAVAELATQVRGLAIQPEAERDYPYGELARSILGRVGEVSAAEVERLEPLQDYRSGDSIGRSGLEAALEPELRGRSGGDQVELDRSGLPSRVLARKPTEPPPPLRLTLDLPLQQTLERVLTSTGGNGVAVAIDPKNGAVLAMASPTTSQVNQGHRALKAINPGPMFRWVTAVAALESGQLSPQLRWRLDRRDRLGGLAWADFLRTSWPSTITLGFRDVLMQPDTSDSDAFFEQVALKLDSTNTIAWARRFGFGQRSGIELAQDEDPGPSLEALWKREAVQSRWYLGDGVDFALGRSAIAATPLQMAVMAAIAVNGGYRVQPHLVQDRSTRASREFLGLQPTTLAMLRSALQPRSAIVPQP